MADRLAARNVRPSVSSARNPSISVSRTSVSVSQSARHKRGKAGLATRRGVQGTDGVKTAESLIKVLDPETKEDRTPLSLLRAPPKPTREKTQGKRAGEVGAATSQFSDGDIEQSYSRVGESTDSGSTASKSVSMSVMEAEEMTEPMTDNGESTENSSVSSAQPMEMDPTAVQRDRAKVEVEEEETSVLKKKDKVMTFDERKVWLAAPCAITLSETPTFFLLEKADSQIAIDSEQSRRVQERNDFYTALLKGKEPSRYAERSAQTLNNPHKNKETQFARYELAKVGVGVTTWDIYDTLRRLEDDDEDSEPGDPNTEKTGEEGEEVGDIDDDTTAFLDGMGGDDGDGDMDGRASKKRSAWLSAPGLPHALMIVERIVVQNVWQAEQLQYRDVHLEGQAGASGRADALGGTDPSHSKPATQRADATLRADAQQQDAEPEAEGALQVLWRFGHPVVRNNNVSCLAWNHINTDILAAGYGDHVASAPSARGGVVCCWSLKNPVMPERVFKIETAGVSSVDFCTGHPSLLAVGHTDGALALFDVRKQGNAPILKSNVAGGQHTGTIWQVKWVVKGKDRGESLISIASDGRVTDWAIKKGLECSNLLRLKRVPGKQQGLSPPKGDALLARQSGGMCLDFNPTERMIYLVGTEDSTIHKCSTSYNEQYLETYTGHTGPVYRCRWSPFSSDVFLSCSSDWTARLWHQTHLDPIFTFQSVPDAVQDISWSPEVSTIFASITTGGRVDVWDVQNPMEPQTWIELEGRCLNCLTFADHNPPVLLVGDNKGDITVLKLCGPAFHRPAGEAGTPEAQEERLLKYLQRNAQ
eukprot:GGOE01062254.1.p1 GENE.GGOE01062254.1~~GGOE01062254.1.p1  ORF type:complete len:833 (-),score=186.25 GGOE01062254.1:284-2734(-)